MRFSEHVLYKSVTAILLTTRFRCYCAEWDENLRTFKKTPKHDWASHGADAFRYLAMAWEEPVQSDEEKPDPIKEMLKPKTLNQVFEEYAEDLIDIVFPVRNAGVRANTENRN